MSNAPRPQPQSPALRRDSRRLPLDRLALQRRLGLLKRLIPAGLIVLVIFYELGPARWVHDVGGVQYHFWADMLIYGTVGPMLAFWLLDVLGRWLEERQTTELQARLLAEVREHARISRQLNDDALQILFAASVLLDSIESNVPELPPGVAAQLREADQSLGQAIHQLRAHLLNQGPPQ
jgi:signal transduction histidine kinase